MSEVLAWFDSVEWWQILVFNAVGLVLVALMADR